VTAESIALGIDPELLRVILITDSDWDSTVTLDEDWDVSAVLTVEFPDYGGGTVWTAVITGPDAVFHADASVADAIPKDSEALVRYVDSTTSARGQIWWDGTVVRRRA
jgi:hypothetical protein